MKNILFTLIALIFLFHVPVTSEESREASEAFRRLMESAHPTPEKHIKDFPYKVPLLEEHKNPLFMNAALTVNESGTYRMQNESSIAVSPKNPDFLISSAVDYRDNSSTWIYISKDGGRSWVNKNLGKPFPEWRSTNDPSVAFDMDGVGYLVYGGFGKNNSEIPTISGENGVFIAKSTNQGETWKAHIPIILHTGEQTLDSTFEDKYYISIDNSKESPYFNDIYVPWKRVTPRDSATQIVISKSTDKGETWSIPVNVSDRLPGSSEDTTFGQSFPLAAFGPDGTVYVVWNHGIEHGVGFARSDDGGKTFTDARIIHHYNIFGKTKYIEGQGYRHTVKGKVRAEAYPVIVTDIREGERNGYLYLCWAADSIPNIYFSRSTDKGDTWSDPIIVHSVQTNDQFWPWLSIDPMNGDLAIMYLDSRDDPENFLVDCYVSYSSNGGLTWIDRRASDVNSDLTKNPFRANAFAGDYSGCAFYDGIIYPSWVDMRNAEESIYDSDVYTAVINTSAPKPVTDFSAEIFPAEQSKAKLKWKAPEERVFGQPLDPADYHYALFRDGEFLSQIGSSITEFIEDDLVPHEEYHYDIYVIAGDDTSNVSKTIAYPGGSQKPGAPKLISAEGNDDNGIRTILLLPGKREDGITDLVNLDQIGIYLDGKLLEKRDVPATDAGKEIEVIIENERMGYYNVAFSVFDSAEPQNESDMSRDTTLYTGKIHNAMLERFESALMKKYLNSGEWAVTGEFYNSEPFSMTESPDGEYESRNVYTLQLFPLICEPVYSFEFWHACIVDKSDEAIVQYSTDHGNTWIDLAEFNEEDYEPWSDGILNSEDWKWESFNIEAPGDTLIFRFKLETNFIKEKDGWYIDDIQYDVQGIAEDQDQGGFRLYPNPASEMIYIDCEPLNIRQIEIFDIFGKKMIIHENDLILNDSNIAIKINNFKSGTYFVKVKFAGNEFIFNKLNVIK